MFQVRHRPENIFSTLFIKPRYCCLKKVALLEETNFLLLLFHFIKIINMIEYFNENTAHIKY